MRGFFSIIICSILLLAVPFLSGCNFQKIKQLSGDVSAEGSGPIPVDATISWNLVNSAIMVNCNSCHAGKTNPDLTGISSVRQNLGTVFQAITGKTKRPMPPADLGYAPLSDCRIAVIKKWMEIGSPEISSFRIGDLRECQGQLGGEPVLPISQMPMTYETLLKKILQPRCLKCHNDKPPVGEEDASGYLFFPYSAIAADPKMWNGPGVQSRIVKFLTRNDDKRMPPPDDSDPTPLTKEEVDFVIKWIDAGKIEK